MYVRIQYVVIRILISRASGNIYVLTHRVVGLKFYCRVGIYRKLRSIEESSGDVLYEGVTTAFFLDSDFELCNLSAYSSIVLRFNGSRVPNVEVREINLSVFVFKEETLLALCAEFCLCVF